MTLRGYFRRYWLVTLFFSLLFTLPALMRSTEDSVRDFVRNTPRCKAVQVWSNGDLDDNAHYYYPECFR